jgi:hypothetical protein
MRVGGSPRTTLTGDAIAPRGRRVGMERESTMTKTVLVGLVLLLATPAAAGFRQMCRQQNHECRKSHGDSILIPPSYFTLHCNGHAVSCVTIHSNLPAPDLTYCLSQDLSACGAFTQPQ